MKRIMLTVILLFLLHKERKKSRHFEITIFILKIIFSQPNKNATKGFEQNCAS